MRVPVVAVNTAVDCPLNTVTEAGTVRLLLLSEMETVVLLGTVADNVTVQVDEPLEVNVVGAQLSELSVGVGAGPFSVTVDVLDIPSSVAVTIAELLDVRVPAVAVNAAVV